MTIIYQKNRHYSLIVGDIKTGNGFEVTHPMNISFDVSKSSSNKDKTNSCTVEIYNLSREKQKYLEQPYIAAVLSAGYYDTTIKRLFSGQVVETSTRKSGNDIITQIRMGDGYTELNHTTLSKAVPPGKDVREVFETLAKEIPGISRTVFNGTNLNNEVIDGYPLSGTAKEMLNKISRAHNVEWQIDDGVLYVCDAGGTITENTGTAYVISSASGMLELPYVVSGDVRRTKRDSAKKKGVQVKILLNPEIVCGSIVKLEDENLGGWYKVESLRSYGEYRGVPWYTDLRLSEKIKVG